MTRPRFVGVIDIGKTNAKVAIVDLDRQSEVAMRKCPNTVLRGTPYPHFDIEALWEFICEALVALNRQQPIDAISVTTHGACAALIDAGGDLALPVLDYEFAGPETLASRYDAVRPDFSESFTPRLPDGLNLGAQLFWQAEQFPTEFARAKWILPYPQYWSFRLTGAVASEITSLGCHTDLWNFQTDLYSGLVMHQGWLDKMPEVRPASAILGATTGAVTERLGLAHPVPVYSGIHDSNASLLAHLLRREPPFSVVSTGTWVIVCAPGGDLEHLDPTRDSLANIDAFGHHVPSARFMGGREYSMLTDGLEIDPSARIVETVLAEKIMLLPSVTEGSGPFPRTRARWTTPKNQLDAETLHTVVSFYLAMMTSECLSLTGAEGDVVVEGPFAANRCFVAMLEAATSRRVVASTASATGTSIGAAMLARMERSPQDDSKARQEPSPAMQAYATAWRKRA